MTTHSQKKQKEFEAQLDKALSGGRRTTQRSLVELQELEVDLDKEKIVEATKTSLGWRYKGPEKS